MGEVNRKVVLFFAILSYAVYFTPIKPVVWNDGYLYLTVVYSLLILYAMVDSVNTSADNHTARIGFLDNNLMKFVSNISMEVYLCHMMIFRIVEKLHIERYIDNRDLSFVIHFVLTFSLALVFAWFVKSVIFHYLSKKFSKLNFLG